MTNEYPYRGYRVVLTHERRVTIGGIPLQFTNLESAMNWINAKVAREEADVAMFKADQAKADDPAERTWLVEYTARRKRIVYERQTVIVTVTGEQYAKTFGALPGLHVEDGDIEQLAVEHGEPLLEHWVAYKDESEDLDEDNFEVVEKG